MSDPAGIVIVAFPLLRTVDAEVKLPPFNVTAPVGSGFPAPPFRETITARACVVAKLDARGVTATVGVVRAAETPVPDKETVCVLAALVDPTVIAALRIPNAPGVKETET